jgi:small subunit ribosomal protein S13
LRLSALIPPNHPQPKQHRRQRPPPQHNTARPAPVRRAAALPARRPQQQQPQQQLQRQASAVRAAAPARRAPLRVTALRLNNVEIPNGKRIEISLQYIYGVGSTTSKAILRDAGVENKRTHELSEDEVTRLRDEVGKYTTEADLRRVVSQNIKRLKDIGSYRGRRHIMGLPVRGQRTKTNARTRKGKPKTVAGRKK